MTERAVRASFVNCSRGEAARINLPGDLDRQPWDGLVYLGWVDPRAPQQAYAVFPHGGRPVGVKLRRNTGGGGRVKMCSLCCTVHTAGGVSLMVASRSGKAGRDGNTVGLDVCSELDCSAYVRGWTPLPAVSLVEETTSVEQRVERLESNLGAFLQRVLR